MIETLLRLFLLFIIYSFFGYISEVISVSIREKKISFSRGYLIGPWIPIYGIGTILATNILDKYRNDVVALFTISIFICFILEYFTSLIMEKIFNLRWWDYSDRKFNINGRVCLENAAFFGIAGIIVIKYLNPVIVKYVYNIPSSVLYILGILLFLIFLLDFIESTYIICKLKINVSKYVNKDSTKEIKEEVMLTISKNATFTRRLINAFPYIKYKQILKVFSKELQKRKKKRGTKNGDKKGYK